MAEIGSGTRTRARLITVVGLALACLLAGCTATAKLGGTPLGGTPAPDFTLTDAGGQPFSLHDFRGKAVVLTFLYTHCPDICPAIAGNLALAAHALGPAVKDVGFVAVSVDPQHDTPTSVAQFTHDHDLDWLGSRWRFGLGNAADLARVWSAYGIGAEPLPAAASAPRLTAAGYSEIDHNAVLYLIDKQGRERTVLDYGTSAQQLAKDLKSLASS